MKKLFLFAIMMALLSACGGGSTAPTDESSPGDTVATDEPAADAAADDGLPAINDVYDDEVFMYDDMNLYVGTYSFADDPSLNGCGAAMPESTEILSISTAELKTLSGGVNETFPYVVQDTSDMYVYELVVGTAECLFGIFSDNSTTKGKTIDSVGIFCDDKVNAITCYTEWQRDAAYDFTTQTIKSVGGASPGAQEALEQIARERE